MESFASNDGPVPNSDDTLLAMRGIVKRFGTTTALDGINLTAQTGEIHALLGENGAGKSTLMHVLAGLTTPNAGTISWQGRDVRLDSPRAALALGIAMVHQHFTLVPAFTVGENLALADSGNKGRRTRSVSQPLSLTGKRTGSEAVFPLLTWKAFQAKQNASTKGDGLGVRSHPALDRAAALGWILDANRRVADLSVGAQQRVEIVKALQTDAQLLIFDEPTAVLAGEEVEELFAVLRRLRDEGRAIILIAHKLSEILAVADRVTVLRRGRFVATAPVADVNAPMLASWMIGASEAEEKKREGREVQTKSLVSVVKRQPEIAPEAGIVASSPFLLFSSSNLTVRGDRGEAALRGLSLDVGRGEIVGIGGVDGNGQTELAEAFVGLRAIQSGTVTWNNGPFVPGVSPRCGYIPQDRRRSGLAVTMSVEDNLLFEAAQSRTFQRGPFLRRKALRELATRLVREFDIRVASPRQPASSLSGGNQQKIVVARALQSQPDWIVAVNPTRGLDIGATRFVHQQLRDAKARNACILLISTDLDEIAALADRTFILSGGTLAPYENSTADAAQIGLLLGGVTAGRNEGTTKDTKNTKAEEKTTGNTEITGEERETERREEGEAGRHETQNTEGGRGV